MTEPTFGHAWSSSDRELFTSRLMEDTRRERAFAAFSDPSQLARWWGPNGFTNTFQEFDLRPGGSWRFIMHGPDGAQYPNHSEFVQVAPPERVVFNHVSAPQFEMSITFDEQEGGTVIGWLQRFESAEACQRVPTFAVAANEQNLDRLAAHVASKP